jgi:hypothetical protein
VLAAPQDAESLRLQALLRVLGVKSISGKTFILI